MAIKVTATKVARTVCRWCHADCRVQVHSENGRLVKIEEDPTDPRFDKISPRTKGCPRMVAVREHIEHPDRLRFPLKRAGERGEDRWEQITWDQALDEIAEKLTALKDTYGPECLMATQGTARHTMWTGPRFMNLFGSPNTASQGTICYGPATSTATAILGWPVQYRADDQVPFDKSGKPIPKCLLFLGMTLSESHPRLWKTARDAKRMGTKVIVMDPRRTRTTEMADIWLQHRPGTDTALLMAMIRTIIEEDLYDKAFVDRWCHGFDQLAERAEQYTPEKAEAITWVPAAKIREAARMYATHSPAKTQHGMGTEQLENCIEAIQARILLAAITGNIDVEGGDFITGLPAGTPVPMDLAGLELPEKLPPEQKAKQIGDGRFKLLSHSGREMIWTYNKDMWVGNANLRAYAHFPLILRTVLTGEPYPVRACLTMFSNPLLTQANAKLVYRALKSLDLYVVKDLFMTPSAQLADYVLPSAAWIERPNVEPFGGAFRIVAGEAGLPAIVPGEHEYYTDYDFYRGLGIRLGQAQYWSWKSLEEFYDSALKPTGMGLRTFMDEEDGVYWPEEVYRKYETMGGFATPSGKLELYSNIFEKLGYDPLPRYEEPKESPLSRPDLAEQYPLMLITGGRFRPFFHSEHRQTASLRRKHPNPIVQIHPKTAREAGVQDGDWVWIETPRGRIRQKCLCFDGIHPQVVHCEHGWWFPELPGEEPWLRGMWESNVNLLTDDDPERCNPRSGGWPLKTALCKVYKCKVY